MTVRPEVDFFWHEGRKARVKTWRWVAVRFGGPTATSFPSCGGVTQSAACGRGLGLRSETNGRAGVSGAQSGEGSTSWSSTRAIKISDARRRSGSDESGRSRRQRVICRAGIRPARVGCTCKPSDSWECRQTVPVSRGRGSQNSRTGPVPDKKMNELTMTIDEEVNADNKDGTDLDVQARSIPGGSRWRSKRTQRRRSATATFQVPAIGKGTQPQPGSS